MPASAAQKPVRIRHGELEGLRADPRAWATERTQPTRWIRAGFGHAIRLAINHFHATENPTSAQSYLVAMMDRLNLRNADRRGDATQQLERYLNWFIQDQPIVLACRLRIELPLGRRAVFCGEISRVDLDRRSDGYRAVLLGEISAGWQKQLRMPLLQRATAQKMQRHEEEFAIGVQELDGSGLSVVRFTEGARDEAEAIAERAVARGLRAVNLLRAQAPGSP